MDDMRPSDAATRMAVEAVERMNTLPADERSDYLEMLGHVSAKVMRALHGEEYVRGYLQAALAELDGAPLFTLDIGRVQ